MTDNITEMDHLPVCDICVLEGNKTRASYDAKTIMPGFPWAYLCERHFHSHTNGELGLGKGQRLVQKFGGINR